MLAVKYMRHKLLCGITDTLFSSIHAVYKVNVNLEINIQVSFRAVSLSYKLLWCNSIPIQNKQLFLAMSL